MAAPALPGAATKLLNFLRPAGLNRGAEDHAMSLTGILLIAAASTLVALLLGMLTVAPKSVGKWLGFWRDEDEPL
jgi:hypothetical protein